MVLHGPGIVNDKFFFMISARKTGLAEPITSICVHVYVCYVHMRAYMCMFVMFVCVHVYVSVCYVHVRECVSVCACILYPYVRAYVC